VKIDRSCIEKLRAYQAPPPLVATIMVSLMILLRRPEFAHYVTSAQRNEKKSDGSFTDYTYSRTGSAKSRRNADQKTPNHLGKINDQCVIYIYMCITKCNIPFCSKFGT